MGTRSYLKLGHGVNHPPPFSDEIKERVELYLFFLLVS
jgi:hypothetical protein